MENVTKFLNTTTGRDKVNRFVQYFSRFLVWHAQRSGYTKEAIASLAALMTLAGQTRKMMRVGRQSEFLRAAYRSLSITDEVVRVTTVVKNLGMALWLSQDALQLFHAAGVRKLDNIKTVARRGNTGWLVALLASLVCNLYKINVVNMRLVQERKLLKAVATQTVKDDSVESVNKSIAALNREKGDLAFAAVQDSLDILIPATALEYVHIESGIVGLAGAITAIMGGYTHWKSLFS
ncbi:Peroxisomal membrane protein PMP27 [Polyrhizophydium stewartii]|uniref:Peroxisomal membrane protein PMP27 n=1 Tax=Polyrhizophydium stewartii TaxID=2732419 RepID=A0ABR4N130_9FUNG